jgi:hypothetical protein
MNRLPFRNNKLLTIIFFLILAVDNVNYAVEEKDHSGFPTFAIYTGKVPVYATLSGGFTFYPDKEKNKADNFFKGQKYFSNIGSSYLSIKFENRVFKFHELKNIKSEWNMEESSITISGQIPIADVEIAMVLKNKKNRDGSFFVTYSAVNRTNRIVDIGFRSLVDTGSEANDGLPLKIGTDNTQEKEIYVNEYKFTPYKSGYWETYEDDSQVGFRNHLTGTDNTPPDQIAFANWERAFVSDWKYFTNKNISTSSDTSVLIWWNPTPVKQGERREVSTEYEIKKKIEGVSFELLDPETGNGRLHIKANNNSNSPKEFTYHLDAGSSAYITLNHDNPLSFTLERESILDKIIPITLHGKGNINLSIKEQNGKVVNNYNLPVKLSQENREQSPKFWKSSKYPIIYNSDRDGLKLKGIVRAKDSGRKLGETELISVKSIQNSFVYLGEVDLREFSGEVLVEIFKQ